MWRYITFKAGQNRDRIRNSGQFSVLGDVAIFPGQDVKIRDYPDKIGTDRHLTVVTIEWPAILLLFSATRPCPVVVIFSVWSVSALLKSELDKITAE